MEGAAVAGYDIARTIKSERLSDHLALISLAAAIGSIREGVSALAPKKANCNGQKKRSAGYHDKKG